MKRVVFSVYIDLSEYDDEPWGKDFFPKIKEYHDIIRHNQEDYAWKCDANYVIIQRDAPWYDEFYQKWELLMELLLYLEPLHCIVDLKI